MDMYGLLGKPRGWYEFCVELNLSTTFLFSESICKNHLLNWKVKMLLKYWSKQETIEVIMKIQIEKKWRKKRSGLKLKASSVLLWTMIIFRSFRVSSICQH